MSDYWNDDNAGEGWVKKATGLWEFKGEKGKENPYKEFDEMTDEEMAKEEQLEKDEINKLKAMGYIEEDYDWEDGCPGCGGPILPRHHDDVMKKSFMHAECSICNVGFTDTTQEYTEIFHYFGGLEVEENYRSYPEIPKWTKWKCPFHPYDGHVAITMVDSSPMMIERKREDGTTEYVSEEYELPEDNEKQRAKKSQELNEHRKATDKILKKLEAKQQAANARRDAAKKARQVKFRDIGDRENKEGDGLNPWL
jgi:hypothetical protein